jgi:transcriptional regulator with XRE-family HTH domain
MSENIPENMLGKRLEEILKKRGWSKYKLAKEIKKAIDDDHTSLDNIKTNTHNICTKNTSTNLNFLLKIAFVLHVTTDYLLGISDINIGYIVAYNEEADIVKKLLSKIECLESKFDRLNDDIKKIVHYKTILGFRSDSLRNLNAHDYYALKPIRRYYRKNYKDYSTDFYSDNEFYESALLFYEYINNGNHDYDPGVFHIMSKEVANMTKIYTREMREAWGELGKLDANNFYLFIYLIGYYTKHYSN